MKIKVGRGKERVHFNIILKGVLYFFFLFILTYFAIFYSIKNTEKINQVRLSTLSTFDFIAKFFGLPFYPIKTINFNKEEFIASKAKIEASFLEFQAMKESEISQILKNLKNTVLELNLQEYKIFFVNPKYYSAGGFVTDVVIATSQNYKDVISINMPVISQDGLFGRVAGINDNKIHIISIFHPLSKIPVYTKNSKVYGVASGNWLDINFTYLNAEEDKIIEGEEVISLDENGLILSGMPFGRIKKVKSSYVIVPFANSRPATLAVIQTKKI